MIHKMSGEDPNDPDNEFGPTGFNSVTFLWGGEMFPTRTERATAFIRTIAIMKKTPSVDGYVVTHEGPILQENRVVEDTKGENGRRKIVFGWRDTPDGLEEPTYLGESEELMFLDEPEL